MAEYAVMLTFTFHSLPIIFIFTLFLLLLPSGLSHPLFPKSNICFVRVSCSLQHIAFQMLTLLHSEWPKLRRVLAILSSIGLKFGNYSVIFLGIHFEHAFAKQRKAYTIPPAS